MHQTPSLSSSDLWHHRSLYNGLPGLQGFLDKDEGPPHADVVRVELLVEMRVQDPRP